MKISTDSEADLPEGYIWELWFGYKGLGFMGSMVPQVLHMDPVGLTITAIPGHGPG